MVVIKLANLAGMVPGAVSYAIGVGRSSSQVVAIDTSYKQLLYLRPLYLHVYLQANQKIKKS